MSTQLISERALARSRTLRARLVGALGPLTMLGGVAWALLAIGVGIVFALAIAPGLIEDLEDHATTR